jgi:long-chain acyl-CoA synthetase
LRRSIIVQKIKVYSDLPFHESLVHMLWHAVERQPATTAVILRDRSINYREFGRATNGIANLLNGFDLNPGPIVVLMPNSIEMDVALMAVMSTPAQVAPVNPFFTVAEMCKVLDGFEAVAIICDEGTREKAVAVAAKKGIAPILTLGEDGESLEQWTGDAALDQRPVTMPRADDLALAIFSGGSTGVPKGVDHTHRALMWGIIQHVSVWPIPFGENADAMLCESADDLVRIVLRNHDQRAGRVDRHPGCVAEPPDVKHRRDVEEYAFAKRDRPDADMLDETPH